MTFCHCGRNRLPRLIYHKPKESNIYLKIEGFLLNLEVKCINVKKTGKIITFTALGGIALGACIASGIGLVYSKTSTSDYCVSCHVHTEADEAWKQGNHYMSESGVKTDCAACHLPPEDGTPKHFIAKTKTGVKDIWTKWFKDTENIDWDSKGEIEYASKIVYNESCKQCHVNEYPNGISDDGISAHLYYDEHEKDLDLQCISCHLNAGHYDPNYSHAKMVGLPSSAEASGPKYESAAEVTSFENFTETIPGTTASIRMIAVPGGSFTIGSPDKEAFHKENEGPQKKVTVSSFFMGEVEVTWDQYWAFYGETMSEGRTPPEKVYANNSRPDVDAVSGPTPPFGNPDQGWGMGERPALTMTHYGAETFCQWLSLKTGRKYRLPTEAEWEYAARAGSDTPYFFEGNPRKMSAQGFKISKPDTTGINSYAIYSLNSKNRTQLPSKVRANAFGLKNMLGNVLEYCSDWYAEDAYASLADGAVDPKGPASGKEHVVRGGLYSDDAADIRSASRGSTHHDAWLKTDPQKPKSIWWYSDIKGIGFRVVCEVPESITQ